MRGRLANFPEGPGDERRRFGVVEDPAAASLKALSQLPGAAFDNSLETSSDERLDREDRESTLLRRIVDGTEADGMWGTVSLRQLR